MPTYVVVEIVQRLNMISESSEPCVNSVLEYVGSGTDHEFRRQMVLPALPEMDRWASPRQHGQIVRVLQDTLADKDPFIRMQGSHALTQIGATSSVEVIRGAIAKEDDSVVRSSLQNDLNTRKKNQESQ